MLNKFRGLSCIEGPIPGIQYVNIESRICCQVCWTMGLPRWLSGKNPPANARRHEKCCFNPLVRKIPWRRAQQPTPVFLLGKSHGQRNLVGYSPWGHRVGHEWSNLGCVHALLKNMGGKYFFLRPLNLILFIYFSLDLPLFFIFTIFNINLFIFIGG